MEKTIKLLFFTIFTLLFFIACENEDGNGDIRGFVTNSVTGEPVRNANVKLIPGGNTTNTGSDGSYEYIDLTTGQYSIQVMSNGYQTNTKGVTVKEKKTNQCDVSLTPGSGMLNINDPNILFGTAKSDASIILRNIGVEDIDWYIEEYQINWISSMTPLKGTLGAGASAALKMQIDRSKLSDNKERIAIVTVASNGGTADINVSVNGATNIVDASNIVKNGLYAYYTFNDEAKNIVEGGKNATAINNPAYTGDTQDGSKAIVLNSSKNSYLNIPEGLIDNKEFSISFWAKGITDGHIFHVETNLNTESGEKNAFNLLMKDGMLMFVVRNYYFWYQFNKCPSFAHGNISDNNWHMITLTSEYGVTKYGIINTKLYIDGELIDAISEEVLSAYNLEYGNGVRFVLGGNIQRQGTIKIPAISNVIIDNLRIYNSRRLSESEINQIYKAEKGS